LHLRKTIFKCCNNLDFVFFFTFNKTWTFASCICFVIYLIIFNWSSPLFNAVNKTIPYYLFYNIWCCLFVCLMVFDVTFKTISVKSWRSVLLVEETGGSEEYHRPVASHWQTLSHNVVHLDLIEIRTHNHSGDRRWLHR
jgi:hypothetical protein